MEKYEKIEFNAGDSIKDAIASLSVFKKKGKLACGSFNGHMLYSDIDDLDSAYKKITGQTEKEFDAKMVADRIHREESVQKHKNSIPELTKKWIAEGNAILDEKYHESWAECVPIRLDDLYQGMELRCCLDIVLELNNNCTLEAAKSIIESQDHSGMSFGLVCSMVKSFCDRGKAFCLFVK